jgi:nucleoid-associated protein YgaU
MAEGLYDKGFIVYFDGGEEALYRTPLKYTATVSTQYHTITYGQSLYDIARKYYGSSSLWYVIADVNDIITDIFNLPVGETIIIPSS